MGGVDKDNATGKVLRALLNSSLPSCCQITVVMGTTAPWLEEVKRQSHDMPWPTQVMVGVNDMAQLMADSDLAIGAAGATAWELCCLGVPTILVVLSDNQQKVARSLNLAGASMCIAQNENVIERVAELLELLIEHPARLSCMIESAAGILYGRGLNGVIQQMGTFGE